MILSLTGEARCGKVGIKGARVDLEKDPMTIEVTARGGFAAAVAACVHAPLSGERSPEEMEEGMPHCSSRSKR